MYPHYGFGLAFGFFHLFCLSFILGVILFLVWAIRTLDKKQLKKWVVGLLVVGLLGMSISALFVSKSVRFDKDGKGFQGDKHFETMEKFMDEAMYVEDADVTK